MTNEKNQSARRGMVRSELLSLQLERASSRSLPAQLADQIRARILDRHLPHGARLPPSRTLAGELGVARNVVVQAFDQLTAEGCLTSRVGAGTFVAVDTAAQPTRRDQRRSVSVLPTPPRVARLVTERQAEPETTTAAFEPCVPAVDHFPWQRWRQIIAAASMQHGGYPDPRGDPALRQALAAHLAITRGISADPEHIVIVPGSRAGLHLVVQALAEPGDRGWVEDPGYPTARQQLAALGVSPVPVPVDAHGLDVEAGRARHVDARLALVTPAHQFPLGPTLTMSRRLALLDWAEQRQAVIIEDDYDGEYRFSGDPLPTLQGLAPSRVAHLGTFSKTMWPGLRLGWLIVPDHLLDAVTALQQTLYGPPPALEQAALATFLDEGHFTRHLARSRHHYARRRRTLLTQLGHHLGNRVRVLGGAAGLHIVVTLDPDTPDTALSAAVARAGIVARPLSGYAVEHTGNGLVLGYSHLHPADIATATTRLAAVIARNCERMSTTR